MRNTKLVAGLSVAALTALGVTAFTFGGNGNQEEKKEETVKIIKTGKIIYEMD